MNKSHSTFKKAIKKIKLLKTKKHKPVLIAIDGGSGAGKSTFAAAIVDELGAVLIPIDDFFSGHIPDAKWGDFTIEEKLNKVFDWQSLRNSVLAPLLNSKPAKWHPIDFECGIRSDGTYKLKSEYTARNPAKIILLEGAYSFGPKLADLVDISILVDVEIKKRHSRLAAREPKEFLDKWHQRWDEVEKYYFSKIRPKNSYDLIVKYD